MLAFSWTESECVYGRAETDGYLIELALHLSRLCSHIRIANN